MSDPSATGAAPAPATNDNPPPAPADTPQLEPKADPPKDKGDGAIKLTSEQLKERLDRQADAARRELLKSIGVEDVDAVKAAVQAAKDRAEAEKTLEEKLADQRAEFERATARLSTYEKAINERAATELSALTDEQRAAVEALAGDDAAARLTAIDKLKPTWVSATSNGAAAPDPAKPPPATTSPPRGAPTDGTGAPPDLRAQYERLKETNPLAAATFLNRHGARAIFPG